MAEATHTPPPFTLSIDYIGGMRNAKGTREIYISSPTHGVVGSVIVPNGAGPEELERRWADARVMAAGVYLLDACKSALECCGDPMDWQGETRKFLLKMRAAVAMTEPPLPDTNTSIF
jgi:hypothetical protein